MDHLRRGDEGLSALIAEGMILVHRYVLEELACGHIPQRKAFFNAAQRMEKAPETSHEEYMGLIETARLDGKGLGMTDVHLLASARLAGARLWTRDAALRKAAQALGVMYPAG